jgi:hypothetical protein
MYVGTPARAAKVAKYVVIDGSACPTQVPCIAPTQAMFSGQKHVEVCSSKESFAKPGVVTVRNLPRGDMSKPQVLHVPNWPSANNLVMILFDDFPSE